MNYAINRTTKVYVVGADPADYDPVVWLVTTNVSAIQNISQEYWKITGDVLGEMTQAEKDVVDATNLPASKTIRFNQVDQRTGELIAQGYTFSGKVFSLSENAQTNILALYTTKDHTALIYPISYSTINDTEGFSVVDAATVEQMYLTALGTKRSRLDSGTALKDQIRAAATKAVLDAIIDNR
jgi:hypothetical protein